MSSKGLSINYVCLHFGLEPLPLPRPGPDGRRVGGDRPAAPGDDPGGGDGVSGGDPGAGARGRGGLGHVRLKVMGLEDGAQPLQSTCGRIRAVVNGEF